jgi:hypothetical protein
MMADLGYLGDTRPLLIGGTDSQWFLRVSPQEEDSRIEDHPTPIESRVPGRGPAAMMVSMRA